MSIMRSVLKTLVYTQKTPALLRTLRPITTSVVHHQEPVKDAPDFDMENPYKKEKRLCILCKLNITPDYKNAKLLSQFQSPYTGRIYGKHITGLCQKKQELVEQEITKAQNCGYMAYYNKEAVFLKDPKLFDPEHPLRPHRF